MSAVGVLTEYDQTIHSVVLEHIGEARETAGYRSFLGAITGAPIQRAAHNLDMAEVNLYRILPMQHLDAMLPLLIDEAADVLQSHDRRLKRLIELETPSAHMTEGSRREAVVAAVYGVKEARLTAQARVRGFRNVILVATGIIVVVDFLVLLLGTTYPSLLTVCQEPDPATGSDFLCPTGYTPGPTPFDTAMMMFVGVLGATIAAVFALRKVRGTRDPYSLVVALAILKLPTGALTAFLVPLLVHGGFIPGFGQFDSPQQLLGWAVLFGYSQELFTATVDRQAATVLSSTPGIAGTSQRNSAPQAA
jgi:hypothetical protein